MAFNLFKSFTILWTGGETWHELYDSGKKLSL